MLKIHSSLPYEELMKAICFSTLYEFSKKKREKKKKKKKKEEKEKESKKEEEEEEEEEGIHLWLF